MAKLGSMKSIIKPMELKDLESVRKLSIQLGYPSSIEELEERFHLIGHRPGHALFVICDLEVHGWIHLEIVFSLIEKKKIEIKALVINEKSRGRGLGSMLIQSAKEWAKNNEVHTIYLSSNIIRDKAHVFYLREGFKKIKTSHFFELKI